MANQTTSNPKIFDTSGTITGIFGLRLIQWVDNAMDIADADNCVFTVNGVTLTAQVQRGATENESPDGGAVLWEIGPFNPAMACHDLTVTTVAHGELHVWVG